MFSAQLPFLVLSCQQWQWKAVILQAISHEDKHRLREEERVREKAQIVEAVGKAIPH